MFANEHWVKTMIRSKALLSGMLGVGVMFLLGAGESPKGEALRLLFSEVQVGSLASEQYCVLIFQDRHFHYEKASRKSGQDRERKVYEGELSQTDWNALNAILDNSELKDLNVPQQVPPAFVPDSHPFTIGVARGAKFQNMEFLTDNGRKPYQSQLKPLFRWWKSFRGSHMAESKAPSDARCSLDNSHPVFSQ